MIYQVVVVDSGMILESLDTGAAAGERARALNELAHAQRMATRYRVVAVKLESSEASWHQREHVRLEYGVYRKLPFATPVIHYAHYSESGDKVAFTPDDTFGAADRQLVMRPGRYLEKYTLCDEDEWRRYCAMFGESELKFATTPDDIESVYINGPQSCMSAPADWYLSDCHPARVYGAGDLAVAYMGDGEDITARALCWPVKRIFGRIYGDKNRLTKLLESAGYSLADNNNNNMWRGARLLRIECGYGFVVPWLDVGDSVDDNGEHLIIGGGYINCRNTRNYNDRTIATGVSDEEEEEDDRECCDRCEESCDETYSVGDESWCSYCQENNAFHCDDCGHYHAGESYAVAANGRDLCRRCARDYTKCDGCERLHTEVIEGVNDSWYCEDCAERAEETPCGLVAERDDDCDCHVCERHREIEDDPRQLDMGF